MASRKLKPVNVVNYTNHLGHVIVPGDEVLAVTTGWGNVGVSLATYLGSGKDAYGEKVVIEKKLTRKKFVHKETGVEWNWSFVPEGFNSNEADADEYCVYHQYGNDKAKANYEKAKLRAEEYRKAVKEARESYHWITVPYVHRSWLNRNRIYPVKLNTEELLQVQF